MSGSVGVCAFILRYVASPHTTLEMHASRHTHYTTHTYTCCCHSSLSTRIASLSEEDEASIQSGKVCSSEWSPKNQDTIHLECDF